MLPSKVNLILLFVFLFYCNLFDMSAQIDKDFESNKDRFFFGGNIGLAFGNVTDIEVSPQFGYYITRQWAVGIGGIYEYYKDNDFANIETHIYGGNLFTRLFIFPDLSLYFPIGEGISLFTQAEYSMLSLESKYFSTNDINGRFLSHNYFIGLGLMQKISEKRGGIYILILYHLNNTLDSPYQNPVIRLGFNF